MYRYKSDWFGSYSLDGGTGVIHLTRDVQAQFDSWFEARWRGLFEARGSEVTALWDGCTNRHHDPMIAAPHHQPRPTLPRADKMASAVIGARLLVQLPLAAPLGATWVAGTITATPGFVLLRGDRVLPDSTTAASVVDRQNLPADGKAELASDGTPWRRNKDGLARLAPFCGPVSTLGEIAANGATEAAIEQGGRWSLVELA